MWLEPSLGAHYVVWFNKPSTKADSVVQAAYRNTQGKEVYGGQFVFSLDNQGFSARPGRSVSSRTGLQATVQRGSRKQGSGRVRAHPGPQKRASGRTNRVVRNGLIIG